MPQKSEIGKTGEKIACQYLLSNGYKIIETNHRQLWGELDIIAKAPDKTLVFVEVKAMTPASLSPENNLTISKLSKLKRTASLYANANEKLVDEKVGWQIDLIAIDISNKNMPYKLRHYKNIS